MIRFTNNPCSASTGQNGTCYSERECSGPDCYRDAEMLLVMIADKQGAGQGICAGGFGVCCVFSSGCGDTSWENSTYLTTDLSSPVCRWDG